MGKKMKGGADFMEVDDECDVGKGIDERVHSQLLTKIRNIQGNAKIVPPSRRENSAIISEFHLGKAGKQNEKGDDATISIENLVKTLKKKDAKVAQKIKMVKEKSKTLSKPLEKVQARKLKRQMHYEKLSGNLNRWQKVIEDIRVSDQLRFPLTKSHQMEIFDHSEAATTPLMEIKNPTPIEKALQEVAKNDPLYKKEQQERDEKAEKFRLTIKELLEKRQMVSKLRAQASYATAKAARQNKIKSKKYHRLLRKEKIKKQLNNFEELQKNDPEEALRQLNLIEKARAEERATLRHRNTGKWARSVAVKAKYDKDSRIALSEQLSKNRELTKKRRLEESDDSDEQVGDEDELEEDEVSESDKEDDGKDDGKDEYKKFVEEYRKCESKMLDVDPNAFISANPKQLKTLLPDDINAEDAIDDDESDDDDDIKKRMTISEAFQDDDVVAEFMEEKQQDIDESMPQETETSMPGWGSWTGLSIQSRKPAAKKTKFNRRMLFRTPAMPTRSDAKKDRIIIRQNKNDKFKEHLVNELPYPFTSVKEFEASLRAPIGKTWVPETAYRDLIAPEIVTKLGATIQPMDESVLIDKTLFEKQK